MYPLVYSNKDIIYLKNKKIIEYDIIEGGYSISLAEKFFDEDYESYLKSLNSKHKRHVEIGKYILRNPEFNKTLFEGFRKYIYAFVYFNDIDPNNILHIKKDSITVIDSEVTRLKFKNVVFRKVNEYSSYLSINKKEFYYNNTNDIFSFKKIKDSIQIDNTLLEVIKHLMKLDQLGKNNLSIFNFLKELRSSYLNKELASTFYKELNSNNQYKININSTNQYYIDVINDDDIDILDIHYNYNNYILPLIQIFI